MTEDEVREMVRERTKVHGQQRLFARQAGLSDTSISLFLAGVRPPGERLLRELGLRKVTAYEKTACDQPAKGA